MSAQFDVREWKPGDVFSASGYWYSKPVLYKGQIEKILPPLDPEIFRCTYREIKPGSNQDRSEDLQELYIPKIGLSNQGLLLFKSGRDALHYLAACYQSRLVAARNELKVLKEDYHRVLGCEIPLEIVERWLT